MAWGGRRSKQRDYLGRCCNHLLKRMGGTEHLYHLLHLYSQLPRQGLVFSPSAQEEVLSGQPTQDSGPRNYFLPSLPLATAKLLGIIVLFKIDLLQGAKEMICVKYLAWYPPHRKPSIQFSYNYWYKKIEKNIKFKNHLQSYHPEIISGNRVILHLCSCNQRIAGIFSCQVVLFCSLYTIFFNDCSVPCKHARIYS